MFLKRYASIILISIIISPISPQAQANTPEHDQHEMIDALIQASGIDTQYEYLAQQLHHQIDTTPENNTATNKEFVSKDELKAAFNSSALEQAFKRQLVLSYNEKRYEKLINALESSQVKKMISMERDALDPVSRIEVEHYLSRLERRPSSEERLALIKTLDELASVSETQADEQATLTEVFARANHPDDHSLIRANAYSRNIWLVDQAQMRLNHYRALYIYRKASDKELQAYIDFYRTPEGLWFRQIRQMAWTGAIRDIGRGIIWYAHNPTSPAVIRN